MRRTIGFSSALGLAVVAMLLAATAAVAEQAILGSKVQIKQRPALAETRQVVMEAKGVATASTLAGDPSTNGASLTVIAQGGTPTAQIFRLAAGISPSGKSYWRRTPSNPALPANAWEYRDKSGESSAVAKLSIKIAAGKALLRAKITGKAGQPVAVVPPDPGSYVGFVFTIDGAGGDVYCTSFGGAAGGSLLQGGASRFEIKKPITKASCPAPGAVCGNGVAESPGETCDGADDSRCPSLCGSSGLPCQCPSCGPLPCPPAGGPCAIAGPGVEDPVTLTLADYGTYSAPFALTNNGDGVLSWATAITEPTYGTVRNSNLPVRPNTSYVLRARFRLAPSTRAYLAVDTYAAGTPKDSSGEPTIARHSTTLGVTRMRDGGSDDREWQEACVAFTTSRSERLLNVRIGGFGSDAGNGPGTVSMRDVILQTVAKTGTWVRFAADHPPSALSIDLLSRYPHFAAAAPSFPVTVPADGTFSDWVDATHFAPGTTVTDVGQGGSVYYFLGFRDATGAVVTDVPLRVEVTTNPDVPAYYASPPSPLAPVILLYLPSEDSDLSWRPGITGLMADEYSRLLTGFEARHSNQTFRVPSRYHASTDMGPAGALVDRPEIADVSSELMHEAGFNGVWSVLGYDVVTQTAAHGITHHSTSIDSVYNPMYYGEVDFDPAAQHASAVAGLESYGLPAALAPFVGTPENVRIFLFDEVQGPFLKAGDPLSQAFCTYLADNGQADLIVNGCHSVAPLVGAPAYYAASAPPAAPAADPDAARLWYWKVRFYNWTGAEILKQVRTAGTEVGGANFPVTINVGQPASGYYSYAPGVETRELLRRRPPDNLPTIDMLWGEEFALGRCYAQWNSVDADFWAALAAPTSGTFGSYVHANDGYVPQKVLSSASRGGHSFDMFTFPMVLGTAGSGINAAAWLDQAATTNDLLARVEPMLYDGKRPPPAVAIFSGQTDPLWNFADRSAECWLCSPSTEDAGIHYLLTHAHYPVDFAIEEDIGALVGGQCVDGPALDGKQALFLDRKFVSNCAFAAIRAWVEAGGILVLGKELPLHNEYGQLEPARSAWIGVQAGPDRSTTAGAALTWNGLVLHPAAGVHYRALTANPGGPSVTTVATFTAGDATGEIAAADITRGAGLIRIASFSAGTWYLIPISDCAGASFAPLHLVPSGDIRPFGFDASLREAMTAILADKGVVATRPVVPSDPLVEGQIVLDRSGNSVTGGAIVLLDYNNSRDDVITVEVPGLTGCVKSVLDDRQYTLAGHTLSLSLTDQEVLAFSTTGAGCVATWTGP